MHPKDNLNEESVVKFHCESLTDAEILYEASKFKFPQIKKLALFNVDELVIDEDVKGANDLMKVAIRKPLKYFYISSSASSHHSHTPPSYEHLSKYQSGLLSILPSTTSQVYISGFSISSSLLKLLFEACANVDHLVLDNCKLQLDSDFSLSKEVKFNIKKLDLFGTLRKESSHFVNEAKLEILADEMAKSSILSTLW
jgi:hypothetical protein